MKIVSINAQCLSSERLIELHTYAISESIDLILVQETWLQPESMECTIPGYNLYRNDRNGRLGGGTAIFYKSSMKVYLDQDLTKKAQGIEYEQLAVKVKTPDNRIIYIINLYNPRYENYRQALDIIRDTTETLTEKDCNYIFAGDLNIDYRKRSLAKKLLLELMSQFNLYNLNTKSTRITETSQTVIDYMISSTSLKNAITICAPKTVCNSDHLGLYSVMSYGDTEPAAKTIKSIRSYKNFDREAFCEDVSNCDLTDFEAAIINEDVNKAALTLQTILQDSLNKYAPEKTIAMYPNYAPWVTVELRNQLKKRNKMRYTAMKTKTSKDWKLYQHQRNQVTYKLRQAKIHYNKEKFTKCGSNVKEVWSLAKKLTAKMNQKCTATTKSELNKINKFFSQVGTSIKNKTHTETNYEAIKQQPQTFKFVNITTIDTIKAVGLLPNWKAPGFDGINGFVIKSALPAIAVPLTKLINLSLKTSTFPTCFKNTIVSPIPKTPGTIEPDQHRPLALLSLLSKVVERIAYIQLYSFLSPLINKNQHGFQHCRSTVTALLNITEKIYNNMENRDASLLIMMDLSKAFDSLQHNILLDKLKLSGLSDSALAWIESYLKDRKQIVRVNSIYSDEVTLECGVPQGSILGPLLFLLYVNDLPSAIKHGTVGQFADDGQIVYNYKAKDNDALCYVQANINDDMKSVSSWFAANSLLLNTKKTKIMAIGHKKVTNGTLPILTVDNQTIEYVRTARNLGVIFDDEMNFKQHVDSILRWEYTLMISLFSNICFF